MYAEIGHQYLLREEEPLPSLMVLTDDHPIYWQKKRANPRNGRLLSNHLRKSSYSISLIKLSKFSERLMQTPPVTRPDRDPAAVPRYCKESQRGEKRRMA